MGKLAKFSKPLIFQSKLLCFSLIYLSSSLSLAVYFTFSATKCIFRWSPFDPVQAPLFLYPSSYGEHKHAIPTTRASCNSPVSFSGNKDKHVVFDELKTTIGNSTRKSTLRYIKQGNYGTFGGKLSFPERISYFDHREDGIEIPCGFLKRFPIGDSVVASAIFNDHDKIRQPRGLGSKTLDNACFFMFVDDATLNQLHYHKMISKTSKEFKIGAWRIVNVSSDQLYENPAMNGIVPKYLIHRIFPNSKYSVWVDAKMQLVIDPFLLIHSLVVKENVDMAISRHPYFLHTMEEAMATTRWKKWWDVNGLKVQIETYCENGLNPWSSNKPYPTAFNPRDQLPFAFVRDKMSPNLKLNMFEVEVFEQVALEYRHNIKMGRARAGPKTKMASPDLFANRSCGKCEGYLLHMQTLVIYQILKAPRRLTRKSASIVLSLPDFSWPLVEKSCRVPSSSTAATHLPPPPGQFSRRPSFHGDEESLPATYTPAFPPFTEHRLIASDEPDGPPLYYSD
ncbi:hypothetical protein STAS_00138 [Striga asiatica]|uniref:TOD1/MUCI70 glycosyltransferase-like domain-containing protein n=1 Tax=Striga asiatica TaxID=4170 RepID=A0A5A7NVN4_STRAF|nr:hypothetical protein STAS_00138 [Striga asiatica]